METTPPLLQPSSLPPHPPSWGNDVLSVLSLSPKHSHPDSPGRACLMRGVLIPACWHPLLPMELHFNTRKKALLTSPSQSLPTPSWQQPVFSTRLTRGHLPLTPPSAAMGSIISAAPSFPALWRLQPWDPSSFPSFVFPSMLPICTQHRTGE